MSEKRGNDSMSKKAYFQYQKELGLPIYIAVDLSIFEPSFADFLAQMRFTKLSEKEEQDALIHLKKNNHSRLLLISEAGPVVAKQIYNTIESDRYGEESIIPKEGYRVYRYKDMGLMVYSFGAKEWPLGCYKDFGSTSKIFQSRMIINRFLSWALVPHGIIGFWGVIADDKIVAQRPVDSKGEVIFIEIRTQRMISVDGVKKLGPHFKILRLDPILKGRNIKMGNEEFLSFLSTHCSYMDSSGLSVPVRQMLQALSKMTEGMVHPQESFRPRTDLSL